MNKRKGIHMYLFYYTIQINNETYHANAMLKLNKNKLTTKDMNFVIGEVKNEIINKLDINGYFDVIIHSYQRMF